MNTMMRLLFTAFFYVCFTVVYGGVVRGVVRDSKTGEALVGATIYVKGQAQKGTTSGFDGTFVLNNVATNTVVIQCNFVSYEKFEKVITVSAIAKNELIIELISSQLELQTVEVMATSKTTDYGARNLEKLSPSVINIVSARSMELSPDLTVAGVLQRVSGVIMEQNSTGDGQYAILRGMDKRYNITLVNGVKISSPDNKQRFLPLDIFPSELLDRLEVTKTRVAETEGDATGGAVNMVMKDAPNQLSIQANVSTGYNEQFFQHKFSSFSRSKVITTAPYEQYGKTYSATLADFGNSVNAVGAKTAFPNTIAGLSVGNRTFNKRFGCILAANFKNVYKGANSTFFDDEMTQTEGTVRLTTMKDRLYSEHQTQYGVHSKLDYRFDKNNKLEFYNALINMSYAQTRQSNSTNFKLNYEPENGNGDFSYQTRLRLTNQQILNSTLQGKHFIFNCLDVNWSLVYSDARKQVPDQTTVNLDNLRQNFVDNIYADADGSTRRWEHNSDNDYSGVLHLKYKIDGHFAKVQLQAGGLYRNKRRDNFYVSYTLKPVDGQQYGVDFNAIDELKWTLYTPKGSVGPLNYKASEKITTGYIQSLINKGKLELIAGVRVENTNQGYFMYFPNSGDNPNGSQLYTDILPNAQLKYSYTPNANLRLSYYRSINRPGFFEIVPYQMNYEEYTEYGNKNLKHAVIENLDARWELFPKPEEQLLVGVFYKNIKSPIEYAYYSVNQRQYGYGPVNLGDAQNLGLELDYIKYIRQFGLKANYTYTHSIITTDKVFYAKDENGNTRTNLIEQTRPLVGQAAHVANLSLLYKSAKNGWNVQLAGVYMGDRILIASRFLNSDYWQKGAIQLDFSADKKFQNGISIFVKANNLLNTPLQEYIKTTNAYNNDFPLQSSESGETLIRKDYFNRSYLIGIRYKL